MAASPASRKNKARRDEGLCTGCGKSPCVCKNTQRVRERKELARVEAAIQLGKKSELQWAAEYCRRRARAAWSRSRKERSEYWLLFKARVADALLKATILSP